MASVGKQRGQDWYSSINAENSGASGRDKYAWKWGYGGQGYNADPTGFYNDPGGKTYNYEFRPHDFVSRLNQTSEARDYADVGGVVSSMGVQGARQGEASAIRTGQQEAASQGLGRGYAAQLGTDIRQEGSQNAAQMMMTGELEERGRRYEQALSFAQSLIEANKARQAVYFQRKAMRESERAATTGLLGDLGGGLIGAAGSVIGAAIA